MTLYQFDWHGSYLGCVDDQGRYLDTAGKVRGKLVGGRDLYDDRGHYRGYIGAQGNYYDEHGDCRGYFRDLPPSSVPPPRARCSPGGLTSGDSVDSVTRCLRGVTADQSAGISDSSLNL